MRISDWSSDVCSSDLGGCPCRIPCFSPRCSPPPRPEVPARVETTPATASKGDRADDPAIWHNPQDPAKSLILSSDKKAGIAIHDLAGRLLAFPPFGDPTNVDLRPDVTITGEKATLVAASDRRRHDHPRLRLRRS